MEVKRLAVLLGALLCTLVPGNASGQDPVFVTTPEQRTDVLTVGDGIRSFGRYNSTNQAALAEAVKQIEGYGGSIQVLAGNYVFTEPVVISGSNIDISLAERARITPDHDDPAGVFHVTGDNVLIEGGKVLADTWVDDQILVHLDSSDFSTVRGMRVELSSAGGNTTTPMVGIKATGCIEPRIEKNLILPNKGMVAINVVEGHGCAVNGNRIRNTDDEGVGGTGEPPLTQAVSRKCYRGIVLEGTQWGECLDNHLWSLGDATDPIDVTVLYNSTTIEDGGGKVTEQGHMRINGNRVELCAIDRWAFGLCGLRFSTFSDNRVGWAREQPDDLGDAALFVGSKLVAGVESTDTRFYATNLFIEGNEIHNFAKSHVPPLDGTDDSLACSIYLSKGNSLTVRNNAMSLQFGAISMLIDRGSGATQGVRRTFIDANTFISNRITGEQAIGFVGSNTVAAEIVIANNVAIGWRGTGANKEGAGLIASSTTDILPNLPLPSLTATTISFTNPDTISDSGNGLAIFPVDSWVQIVNDDDATNNQVVRVTASTAAALTVDPSGAALVSDTAGETITLRTAFSPAIGGGNWDL